MRNVKRIVLVLVLMVVLVGFVGVCALAGSGRGTAKEKRAEAMKLVDKYNACNKKFETIYYDLETTVQGGSEKYVYTLKHCSSNEKKQWIGRMKCYNKDGTVNQGSSTLVVDIFNEKRGVHLRHYNPEVGNKRPPRAAMFSSSRDKVVQQYSEDPQHGGPLTGQLFGSNDQSIYDLLKVASNLKLHNEVTKIIGYDTYLIEVDTQYGVVKAWISPDLGYNCLKWEIIKEPNQFYRDGQFANDGITGWTAVYDAEKVEQIDGHYFVTQAKFNLKVKDGYKVLSNDMYHYNLKNIDLNPDFEALGAFKIQLPEGTVVTDKDIPGIVFVWSNGKFVPDMDKYLIKSLTGKPLPGFEEISMDFDLDSARGKIILVCFWDIEQRPSRHCVRELAKKAEQLKEKGVSIVAVQASRFDKDKLDKWVKDNNISFAVGMIEGEEEETKLNWGVKSLPWLILTDREHIVTAEGFGLDELEKKIKEACDAEL